MMRIISALGVLVMVEASDEIRVFNDWESHFIFVSRLEAGKKIDLIKKY